MNRLRELSWPRGKWTDMFVAVSRLQSERPSKLWAKGECVRTRQDDWIKNDVKIASLFFWWNFAITELKLNSLFQFSEPEPLKKTSYCVWTRSELVRNQVNFGFLMWKRKRFPQFDTIRVEHNVAKSHHVENARSRPCELFFCTLQCVCNVDIMLAPSKEIWNSSISLLSAHQHVMFGRPKSCALLLVHPMINGNVIEREQTARVKNEFKQTKITIAN